MGGGGGGGGGLQSCYSALSYFSYSVPLLAV